MTYAQGGRYFGANAAITACLVAAIANIPFNVMPMILGAAADAFQLVPAQIGLLGGCTLIGWVAGTALSFFIVHRLNWRFVATVGTIVAVLGLQLSLHLPGVAALDLCWFILGLGASLPTCIAFEILGKTANQERYFGTMTLAVVLISAVVLWLFPIFLLSRWGYTGLVFGLSALFLVQIAFTLMVPAGPLHAGERRTVPHQAAISRPAQLALVAFLIFFTGESGLWAFLERAGREIAIAPEEIGTILAVLKVVGGIATAMPILIAKRLGDRWPFVAGFIGTVVAVAILQLSSSSLFYAIGGWIWEFFFTVMFCYTTAAIGRLDRSGRIVVLVPGAIGLGGAIGPTVAGFLKVGTGYLPIYGFTTACIFLSTCIMLALLRRPAQQEALA
ncbi:MAG: hypothetical protein JWM77_1434 [Rhodospirillales bacterium]|nr:hypothetical protein [Rhodospirillales bacterium]